jgi:hypothetical protein
MFIPKPGIPIPGWSGRIKRKAPLFAKGAVSFFVEEPVSLKKLKN